MFTVLAFIGHTWLVTPRQHRLGLEVQLLSVSFFCIKLLIVCKYNKRSDISRVRVWPVWVGHHSRYDGGVGYLFVLAVS
jgi:hypothetical protein